MKDINFSDGYDSRDYCYSQGILVTKPQQILFISGQVGITIPNEEKSFEEQINLAYENLEKVLSRAQLSFDHIVKVTELVVGNSLLRLQMVNDKKKAVFKKQFPASTYIPVESLALPGMLFEIEAIAVV